MYSADKKIEPAREREKSRESSPNQSVMHNSGSEQLK